MDIVFTPDQQTAYDGIIKFIETGKNHMALLEGCAGSGKSTLCSSIVDYVLQNALFGKIAMVAPTWKAVKVMKNLAKEESKKQIDFSSLHSLLGLKHSITIDGKEVFKRDMKSPCKLAFYDLVIVDEASMVADELFHELENQNYRGTKILFVGDSNQINPVNHMHAIPMLDDQRLIFNISHFKLTQIVRQAESNPIIRYSQKILKDEFVFERGLKDMIDKTGVVMLNGDNTVLRNLLQYYFCSEEFDKNSDYCKLTAWTNKTVDMFNAIIRNMKYGKAPKIVLNEKLIADKPIRDMDDEIIFTTNEDLIVLNVEVKNRLINEIDFHYYECLVRGDEDQEHIIHILHEKSEKIYNITVKNLSQLAIKETDPKKRVLKWKNYYAFMENFASVNYNYAITTHCSQGSTYDNCFVVYSDIAKNFRTDEMKRILYTAVTRPKNLLYIL
jgi:ATP-dependent exoDNAse (exonuclease V) alpha subunit